MGRARPGTDDREYFFRVCFGVLCGRCSVVQRVFLSVSSLADGGFEVFRRGRRRRFTRWKYRTPGKKGRDEGEGDFTGKLTIEVPFPFCSEFRPRVVHDVKKSSRWADRHGWIRCNRRRRKGLGSCAVPSAPAYAARAGDDFDRVGFDGCSFRAHVSRDFVVVI